MLIQKSLTPSGVLIKPKTSLDSSHSQISTRWRVSTPEDRLRAKIGRVFSCALSGLRRAEFRTKDCYFLTLTSCKGATDIGKHWDLLVKRVRREMRYPFQYMKVETEEGNGVIHAIFHSAFEGCSYDAIHAYFSCLWQELHNSPIVWCSKVSNSRKVAGYMCQYVSGQSKLIRSSCSVNWIFPKYREKFLNLIKKMGSAKLLRFGISCFFVQLVADVVPVLSPDQNGL